MDGNAGQCRVHERQEMAFAAVIQCSGLSGLCQGKEEKEIF